MNKLFGYKPFRVVKFQMPLSSHIFKWESRRYTRLNGFKMVMNFDS